MLSSLPETWCVHIRVAINVMACRTIPSPATSTTGTPAVHPPITLSTVHPYRNSFWASTSTVLSTCAATATKVVLRDVIVIVCTCGTEVVVHVWGLERRGCMSEEFHACQDLSQLLLHSPLNSLGCMFQAFRQPVSLTAHGGC